MSSGPVGATIRIRCARRRAKPGFERLTEADVVGEQQARVRHLQGTQDRDIRVGGEQQATRLGREQDVRPEGLLQEESVVVDTPLDEARRGRQRLDLLERELVDAEAACQATEAIEPVFPAD
jgi:hypothetical protein